MNKHPETDGKSICIEPNWIQIARFQANRIADTYGVNTAISIIEVIRYLYATKPDDLELVLQELRTKLENQELFRSYSPS